MTGYRHRFFVEINGVAGIQGQEKKKYKQIFQPHHRAKISADER